MGGLMQKQMDSKIKHFGVIQSIESNHVKVRIAQTSACETCSASGHCSASESKEKIIDVYNVPKQQQFKVGDGVILVESQATGMKAVFLGFGIPFLILIATLFISMKLTANEPFAALLSLASLIPYYAILYIMRGKLRRKLTFHIEQAVAGDA